MERLKRWKDNKKIKRLVIDSYKKLKSQGKDVRALDIKNIVEPMIKGSITRARIGQILNKSRNPLKENWGKTATRGKIGSYYSGMEKRSKKRNSDFHIIFEQFKEWYEKQDKVCHYCGTILNKDFRIKDDYTTIDRKDISIGYTIENIALCCWRCNATKSNFFTEEDMLQIGKIVFKRKNIHDNWYNDTCGHYSQD